MELMLEVLTWGRRMLALFPIFPAISSQGFFGSIRRLLCRCAFMFLAFRPSLFADRSQLFDLVLLTTWGVKSMENCRDFKRRSALASKDSFSMSLMSRNLNISPVSQPSPCREHAPKYTQIHGDACELLSSAPFSNLIVPLAATYLTSLWAEMSKVE